MAYEIADFCFDIDVEYSKSQKSGVVYSSNSKDVHYKFTVTKNDKEYEQSVADSPDYESRHYTMSAILRYIAEWLPLNDAFLLHSATFDVDGVGVAFAAHSGTGKTTHMLLWQKLLGERMTVVNGDKPIVRFFENEPLPFAYGTPWNGKEKLGCNMRTPLKHICFITRAKENSVVKVEKGDIIDRIFNQVYMPKDPAAMVATMKLIDRLLSVCELWEIRCNMDDDAAKVAYNAIFGNS